MYTKFNVSILLACFAYTPLAIKLGTKQDDVPAIAGQDEITAGNEDEGTVADTLTTMIEEEIVEEV